jgi:hypothetical protein
MCACDYDADEYILVHESTFPVASRAYKCDECYQPIPAGSAYKRVSSLGSESGWSTWRFCGKCVRVRAAHNVADPQCRPLVEKLYECVRENVHDREYLEKFRAAWREMKVAA